MNCSGKHAAMLATCVVNGWSTHDYLEPTHPLQQAVRETLEELAGEPIGAEGVDGCGAPLLSTSLTGLARAFRTLAVATEGPEQRVADPTDEYFGAGMRPALLERLARETGGRFYTPSTVGALANDMMYTQSGTTVVERRELWDMPAIFLVLIGLMYGYSAPLCALVAAIACLPVALLRKTTRAGIRSAPVAITDPHDFNRDRRVNARDLAGPPVVLVGLGVYALRDVPLTAVDWTWLVAGSVVMFLYSVRNRDHDHADRLSLFPLEDEPSVPRGPSPKEQQ